ncbi:sensor domain-containing diguanylate cyclase/phosphohydrolase [Stieleria varia]|uniref:diguanylate cyclase n=1 Tax=Stieleria varia TaxID=2528005 RepID=A0A5C6B8T5_9BACT|nr:diguanylate cyclase [Stieleria varia]TWU08137.1 Response regulator PleD [Stieleria varia]
MKLPFKIPVVANISLSLVGLLASVLTVVTFVGIMPDSNEQALKRRKELCESSAIGFSLMADRIDRRTMQKYLDAFASRCSDLASLGVRRDDGTLIVEVGDHAREWAKSAETDSQIWVRLYSQGEPWGNLEAAFDPVADSGWLTSDPEMDQLLFVSGICFVIYFFYLRIVLKQLNPANVIPARVREALDTLAEGLLIMDRSDCIVLANRAFENATGTCSDRLIGTSISTFKFVSADEVQESANPWKDALKSDASVTGRLLGYETDGNETRIFSVSSSPIKDDSGKPRGTLTTFEDVTHLEKKKRELTTMVECLQESSIAIKQQNCELEHLATRDPLTGCLNRRSFFERFDSEWKTANRYENPLCAMMVDIDFFKSINDTYGHSMGDEVLRQVAATLMDTARESDIVSRYGGEEFSVLLPMTTIDDAAVLAERIRSKVEALRFPGFSITTSVGVSTRTEATLEPQDLLDQADKCLYAAKRGGRNQVVRWDEVPEDMVVDESKISRVKEEQTDASSVPYHAVTALISALAYRDQSTATHGRRVADLCVATAEGLLSLKDCYTLEVAALLHDIGKIGVPDHILLKPGPLTQDEWDVMRRNDTIGKEIIRASFGLPSLTEIVEHYQRHYDGGPSQDGLAGNSIPLGARILAIADAYDAMISDQVFRKGRSKREAAMELRRCAGTQFDPELVERFIATISDKNRMRQLDSDQVSTDTALVIGLQIERLAEALDDHDYDSLDAMSTRLQMTAEKYGAQRISSKASELKRVLDSDRDHQSITQIASEMLDLCRFTQHSFVDAVSRERQSSDEKPRQASSLHDRGVTSNPL